MIHEAVHAYQQAAARDAWSNNPNAGMIYGFIPSLDWVNGYRNSFERMASQIALDANNKGRINLSIEGIADHNVYIGGHLFGEDFPFELPTGVP